MKKITIDGNNVFDAGLSNFHAEGTINSDWIKNPNYENSYILKKPKNRIYGWIEEVVYGDKKGMLEAVIPSVNEDDIDEECRIIGYFNDMPSAMSAVLEANHPDYSNCWI